MSRIENFYFVLEDRNEERIVVRNDDPFFTRCSHTDQQRSVLPLGGAINVTNANGTKKYKKVYKALNKDECNEVKMKTAKGFLAIRYEQAKKFNKPEEIVVAELFRKILTEGTNFIFANVDQYGLSRAGPYLWNCRDTSSMPNCFTMLIHHYVYDDVPTKMHWLWRYSKSTKLVRRASFHELMINDPDGAYLLGGVDHHFIGFDFFGTIYFKKYYHKAHRIEGKKFFLSTMEKNFEERSFLF